MTDVGIDILKNTCNTIWGSWKYGVETQILPPNCCNAAQNDTKTMNALCEVTDASSKHRTHTNWEISSPKCCKLKEKLRNTPWWLILFMVVAASCPPASSLVVILVGQYSGGCCQPTTLLTLLIHNRSNIEVFFCQLHDSGFEGSASKVFRGALKRRCVGMIQSGWTHEILADVSLFACSEQLPWSALFLSMHHDNEHLK